MTIQQILAEAKRLAKENVVCKRKQVGVCFADYKGSDQYSPMHYDWNRTYGECTGEIGNCGCCHAEICGLLEVVLLTLDAVTVICEYSPCTNCANALEDSRSRKNFHIMSQS